MTLVHILKQNFCNLYWLDLFPQSPGADVTVPSTVTFVFLPPP